jgi:hypothetical protein
LADQITELSVFDSDPSDKSVFNEGVSYVIPLYQRAFAWSDDEINTLIDDIRGFEKTEDGSSYYLGTLVVSKKHEGGRNYYEVIDGQQRLTALFLILSFLRLLPVQGKRTQTDEKSQCKQIFLTFECREKSDDTLQSIYEECAGIHQHMGTSELDEALLSGKKIIEEKFTGRTQDETESLKADFKEKLSKVKLYRIEVPEHTDLNRYFETMNTRGEQLEQADILKARLMGYLQKGTWDKDGHAFAAIWDACCNMNGYVQMHFDTEVRENLFDKCWNNYDHLKNAWNTAFENDNTVTDQDKANSNGSLTEDETEAKTLEYLIHHPVTEDSDEKNKKSNVDLRDKVRFESIISFPYFLLHVLKIYLCELTGSDEVSKKVSLDDQKLKESFEKAISDQKVINKLIEERKKGEETCKSISAETLKAAKAEFSKGFIGCLLKCRFLFDKYIVKRDHLNENTVGSWSIKTLHTYETKNKKSYEYVNSVFVHGDDDLHKRIVMLQSCLRVSFTSPKTMHWITDLLKWLYQNCNKNRADLSPFEGVIENQIRYGTSVAGTDNASSGRVTVNGYLEGGIYDLGTATPHLVFNYLDYLLCKEKPKDYEIDYEPFSFEYRNSVEHWYPQNPSDGTFDRWDNKDLDFFGNLCLVQRSTNSKFSNLSPVSKLSTFEQMISKGSLKLRIMAKEISKFRDRENASDSEAIKNWKDNECKKHGEEMLRILKDACPRNA